MKGLNELKDKLNKVNYISELSENDIKAIAILAKLEANKKGFEYNPYFLNEKSWLAIDLIDRVTELLEIEEK